MSESIDKIIMNGTAFNIKDAAGQEQTLQLQNQIQKTQKTVASITPEYVNASETMILAKEV